MPKKRKASNDDASHNDSPAEKEVKQPAKKRKSKGGKEEDKMPLAERTAVGSLKKAMYIGAHVSGAGGEFE